MATFDDEVTLIGKKRTDYDDEGNPIVTAIERTIWCNELSVHSAEFYNAANIGLKPSYVLSIHKMEYDGETSVKYKGNTYKVLRTYSKDDLIELTVGDKVGT